MKGIFYFLIKHLLRYYNRIYFRNIEVYGYENIPEDGGVLFSPNHQGAFLDPLIIGSMTPKKITSLTRSDVFGGPFQWFLDAFQMLPVYRIRNGYSNLKKNDQIFAQCYELLSKGKYMMMFSEGGHHDEYFLQRLSKGSSRLVFQAQKHYPNKKIYLQPVGINYGHHRQPRCSLHLVFGKPIEINPSLNPKLTEAENINNLREILQERMRDCLWIPDHSEHYGELKNKVNRQTTQMSFYELKDALHKNPSGLPTRKNHSKIVSVLAILLSIPNIFPLWITRKVISKFEDVVFVSSLKYAMGVFFFPLWWFCSGLALAYLFGNPVMTWYLLICIFSLFIRQRFLLL
ncbi:MAG: lysophospholipid acyltransferase family protein [Flavobacteriaceae bacterium]|nr:lysophospholipid acyltransferase family protein [Flavobacteriaceae bacterium]MDG2385926.1 lysophospholipid acyltransferase family protein [Flavobacteriaceae bacterium]